MSQGPAEPQPSTRCCAPAFGWRGKRKDKMKGTGESAHDLKHGMAGGDHGMVTDLAAVTLESRDYDDNEPSPASLSEVAAAATGTSAVPPEWLDAYDTARRAVAAEAVRAAVEWSLKRKWEVPSAADQSADVRGAVDRRLPDQDSALMPEGCTTARDVAKWSAAVRSLKQVLTESEGVAAVAAECERLLLAAMAEVVDPNLRLLGDHLQSISEEQLKLAAEALRTYQPPESSALDAAVHAKATAVHHVMAVALNDVQQQFVGGVSDVCNDELVARLDDPQAAAELIASAVEVRRRAIESPWRLSALIGAIQSQVNTEAVEPAGAIASGGSGFLAMLGVGHDGGAATPQVAYAPPSLLDATGKQGGLFSDLSQLLEDNPMDWLRKLVVGLDDAAEALPAQPPGLADFVLNQIADYLDPHIDGDKQPLAPAALRALDKEGTMPERLKAKWDAGAGAEARAAAVAVAQAKANAPTPRRDVHGSQLRNNLPTPGPPTGPSPPFDVDEDVLAGVYIRHAVRKMNAVLCFGPHVPGVGRQPISAMAQQRHVKILAVSILEAVQRDFNHGKPLAIRGTQITTEALESVVQDHMNLLFSHHNDLNAALAIANKEGEEARKAERMRIWGHA
mmetsp:Transcript_20567/g.55409  ORF Transcript_20567/g.55409 Transcript_20567/m.55409 type:complete len:622 (+) Transcript_20567:133-1998(+)